MKICVKCNISKTAEEFPKSGRICKKCKAEYLCLLRKRPDQKEKRKKYKDTNREKINKQKREHYKRNAEYYKHVNLNNYYNNVEYCRERQRKYQVDKETANMESWLVKCLKHCRSKDSNVDFDINYLIELYKKQNGRCAISNIMLTYNRNDLLAASIDRIQSNIPHIKSNVQLICSGLNRAKREYSDNDVYNMLRLFAVEYNNISIKGFNNFEYQESISNYSMAHREKLKLELVKQFDTFYPPTYSNNILQNDYSDINNINVDDYIIDGKWRSYKPSNTTWAGKRIIWHFHPHLWEVKVQNKPLISDVWKDHNSIIFKKTMDNLVNGTSINYDRIIREFIFSGVGVTSQMHVGFAKAVIAKFNTLRLPVYDPFAGWGARMLASNSIGLEYFATELSQQTHNGLLNIISHFNIKNSIINNTDYRLHIPSNMFLFTSPPFGSEGYINSNNSIDHEEFNEKTKHLQIRIIHINKELYDVYNKFNPTDIITVATKSSASSNTNEDYLMIYRS